ncbi:hypothetical protein BDZ91DRAFT_655325 [Kalaharituber pfeilii]|nr:hypothetical protein BDZ91DRAFT_655325 [Kalaharituber pfeilii]
MPSAGGIDILLALGWLACFWYCLVWLICSIGYLQIRERYSTPRAHLPPADNLPFVSVLRPIKGHDPNLSLTLNSTFLLEYPAHLYELLLCVASPHDPCVPIVRALIARYPQVNAKLVLGEEDVGPNPKIRTLSKAYREAKGDIMWILDSNIWVEPSILGRSVRKLCGIDEFGRESRLPYKFVHHLPIAVDCAEEPLAGIDPPSRFVDKPTRPFGGRLEEAFLSTSHCKFYTAINAIAIAPCALGKSNMFRRSHLAAITPEATPGILNFAYNICEDHMIAEHIWKTKLPEELNEGKKLGKHALGADLVFQPVSGFGVRDYCERRTRWLRVRKYIVLPATLAEPATESLLCSLIGGLGFSKLAHAYDLWQGAQWSTWSTVVCFWVLSVALWSFCDYINFRLIHGFGNIALDNNTPHFIRDAREKKIRRKWEESLFGWLLQWLGRETLALPIFLWALVPGDVYWRGGRYRVGWDGRVKEVGGDNGAGKRTE